MAYVTFDQPALLWLLFSIPLLLFTHLYFMRHARRKAIVFGNFSTLERIAGKKLLTKNLVLLSLRVLVIVCLVFAVAGTTLWRPTQRSTQDIVIVIDASASMTTQDMDGRARIDVAKESAKAFVQSLNTSSKISVVQFSGLSEVIVPPTYDKNEVLNGIDSVSIKSLGGSDIAGAMVTGTNLLSVSPYGRVMVLLTDGVASASLYDEDPIKNSLIFVHSNHVVVNTIGVGTSSNQSFIPAIDQEASSFDEQNLKLIADSTGGHYAWARSPAELQSAFKVVGENGVSAYLPTRIDLGLALAALVVLFIEWGLLNTRYRLLP